LKLTIEILSNIKNKIPQDKIKDIIELLSNLLSKIDKSNLTEDDKEIKEIKQKLSNLKKDLEEKMKQKSIS
jgi:glutamine synthetase type III